MAPHATQNCMTILRCGSCTTLHAPETACCSSCGGANLESARCSGTGSIVSWKVVEPLDDGAQDDSVVTLAIVELDDGPWLYSKIEGSFPDCAEARVRVAFRSTAGDDGFPVFGICAA
ncbi:MULTISPECIES: Zn-ribbon domain-containing OB-fold protein [Rhodococcus]|uniref:Zn-ribbon domain-containing OB-fold protein n=1 Tax=Rhodococcus TaxID=1827 RepID=UPI000904382D|nr:MULTISPECIES: OB-fold domain-containing protein [Rhodococcus]APE09111.1 hypothetical protein BO226_07675 [Rhodococcus sp. 2G]QXU55745.1 OB-fold domain-containing protein [Rhodococcus sp. LW-XY12]